MATHSIATPGHLAQTGHSVTGGKFTLTAAIVVALLMLGLVATIVSAWVDLRADHQGGDPD